MKKKDDEVVILPVDLIKFIDEKIKSWKGMYEDGGKNQSASGAIIALKGIRKKIFEINKGVCFKRFD